MFVDRYNPSLLGTLKQMAVVSWAIWSDYRDHARLQRARARHARRYALTTAPHCWPTARTDAAHIAVVVLSALASVSLALYVADAWPFVLGLLGWGA